MAIDLKETEKTRARYQRIAPLYDVMELFAERRYQEWRPRIWELVQGSKVLEVGVGTGKNMPYYPEGAEIKAIDLTPGMLERAKKKAAELKLDIDLGLGDVQTIRFPDESFDAIVATFVFCSVPDPVLGLFNMRRMLKSNGRILLLEHMRAEDKSMGLVMDILNPMVVRMMGANINRRTVENVQKSGLVIETLETLSWKGIFKLIVARKC